MVCCSSEAVSAIIFSRVNQSPDRKLSMSLSVMGSFPVALGLPPLRLRYRGSRGQQSPIDFHTFPARFSPPPFCGPANVTNKGQCSASVTDQLCHTSHLGPLCFGFFFRKNGTHLASSDNGYSLNNTEFRSDFSCIYRLFLFIFFKYFFYSNKSLICRGDNPFPVILEIVRLRKLQDTKSRIRYEKYIQSSDQSVDAWKTSWKIWYLIRLKTDLRKDRCSSQKEENWEVTELSAVDSQDSSKWLQRQLAEMGRTGWRHCSDSVEEQRTR